ARALDCAAWLIAITDLAQAAPPLPATRAEIEARLQKAAHGLSATEVADLGASAGVLLAQIADDRAVATTMRARAMEALTYVRTPVTRDFLENFLIRKRPSSDAVDHVLLRKAAMALGWQA